MSANIHLRRPSDPLAPPPAPGGLLAELTTIGLGGPARALYRVTDAAEVADVVGGLDSGPGALVVGGGSNLVVADRGVDLPVVLIRIPGVRIYDAPAHDPAASRFQAVAEIGAGADWDDVVAELVAAGWAGVETLSGIPGSAGATPVQNVGAYGTEISDRLIDVTVYDRRARALRRLPAADLGLGYRTSVLRGTERAVVTSLRIGLTRRPAGVIYPELARRLGVAVGGVAPAAAVREAVLALRRAKGMVLDPADPDTRSVGSFFTNPIVDAAQLDQVIRACRHKFGAETTVPHYPAASGRTKLSAAWLIERSGFARGYPGSGGITLSTKHTLALTNRGAGTTAELVALAREIRAGVRSTFGVILVPEPILVGVRL